VFILTAVAAALVAAYVIVCLPFVYRALDAGILAATLHHPWNEHVRDAPGVTSAADWRELPRAPEPVQPA